MYCSFFFFFSSRRRHTRLTCDWSSDVCSSDLADAVAAARKAGAIVQSKPGQSTDVLVRGRPNKLQIAGTDGGLKLMEIRRLAARGHSVKVIGERQFWKLVESSSRTSKRKSR